MPWVHRASLTGRLLLSIFAAVFGSAFQHGFNDMALMYLHSQIQKWIFYIHLKHADYGIEENDVRITRIVIAANFIYKFGGFLGSLLSWFISYKMGIKRGLILNNIILFTSLICISIARVIDLYELFIIGCMILGINSGLNSTLAPLYLSEISPVNLRGSIGMLYPLIYSFSISIFHYIKFSNRTNWLFFLYISVIPSIIQLITLYFSPETPYYTLIICNKEIKTEINLKLLRGKDYDEDEIQEIKNDYDKFNSKITLNQIFTNLSLRKILFILIIIMIVPIFTGINEIIFSLYKIFKLKLSKLPDTRVYISLDLISNICIFISIFIVEKIGRRFLILSGYLGMFISILSINITLYFIDKKYDVLYISLFFNILFRIFYSIGPVCIPWILVYDLFNHSLRPIATSIVFGSFWLASIIYLIFNTILNDHINMLNNLKYLMIPPIISIALCSIFVYKKFPDTRNKSFKEIHEMFGDSEQDVIKEPVEIEFSTRL